MHFFSRGISSPKTSLPPLPPAPSLRLGSTVRSDREDNSMASATARSADTAISRILVGYDGSHSAQDAFAFALDLAKRYGAELHVLAVARPPEFAEEVETEALIEN